jgi:hypothetical protein
MSRDVLIPIAFVGVVVLRLTMLLFFVPQRRGHNGRARGGPSSARASDSSPRPAEPRTVVRRLEIVRRHGHTEEVIPRVAGSSAADDARARPPDGPNRR